MFLDVLLMIQQLSVSYQMLTAEFLNFQLYFKISDHELQALLGNFTSTNYFIC